MKRLISYMVIASIFSASLSGCSNKTPMPEIFGQKIDDNYKNMEPEGYKSTYNSIHKKLEKTNVNGGVTTILLSREDGSAVIDKKSDFYLDFPSCIMAFNEDNKNIQEIINDGEKQNVVNDNMAYVQYGKSRILFKTTPCSDTKGIDEKINKYQYEIHVEGINAKEANKILSSLKDGAVSVLMVPITIIGFVFVIMPLTLITLLVANIMGFKGG